uniref:Anaphase-promoting complex subunit 11 n=1 Tax=Ditylenchus dipsaci TaxID=166011 RepID=A0A915DQL8_9BILA
MKYAFFFTLQQINQIYMASTTPSLELPTKTRLKMKIKTLKIVGEWKWTQGNGDNCGICQSAFEACCADCKYPGEGCPLAVGVCKHAFHLHCISKWCDSSTDEVPVCPFCRQEWKCAT